MVRSAPARDPLVMNSTTSPSPRSLTRSTTDRKVAGVSGGLGAYLGIDPLLVRIGFVVTLLAYVAMMFLVPSEDHAPAGAVLTDA